MKALVLYDSEFGNTERVACAIAVALAPLGTAHARTLETAGAAIESDEADILFVGCPTHARDLTDAWRAVLSVLPPDALADMPVAVFDTRYDRPVAETGSAAEALAEQVQRKGARLVVPPESFFVIGQTGPLAAGELARAAAWANAAVAKAGSR